MIIIGNFNFNFILNLVITNFSYQKNLNLNLIVIIVIHFIIMINITIIPKLYFLTYYYLKCSLNLFILILINSDFNFFLKKNLVFDN